ncbi:hypothetical protein L3X38_018872 [Prunus dulcis]|uniref:Uncharacterized protein n=1 Tax=Prunus dulcis TaxID=3755 RepID=A0AAD4W9V9_PRUDU|nr:hypothetical protein L3X38_018872 [Prunus dulcis]
MGSVDLELSCRGYRRHWCSLPCPWLSLTFTFIAVDFSFPGLTPLKATELPQVRDPSSTLSGSLWSFLCSFLQVFYGNIVQWDDGGDFNCASFVCLVVEGLD